MVLGSAGKEQGGGGTVKDHAYTRWGRSEKTWQDQAIQGNRGGPESSRETKCPIWRGEKGSISDESDSNEC